MRFFLSYGAHPILVEAQLARPPLNDFVGGTGKIPIDVGEGARRRAAVLRWAAQRDSDRWVTGRHSNLCSGGPTDRARRVAETRS
jgi:hypothetical protein